MRKILFFNIILFLLFYNYSFAEFKIGKKTTLEIDYTNQIYTNLLSGATEQSYLDEGTFHVQQFEYLYEHQFNPTTKFQHNLSIRYTDDLLVDEYRVNLQEVYLDLLKEGDFNYEWTIGDIYGDFTTYTLAENLRGVYVSIGKSGYKCESLYSYVWLAENNEQYTRYVGGVRIEKEKKRKYKVGFNYVLNYDDPHSVKNDTDITLQEESLVFGTDFTYYPFRYLRVKGEFVSSEYDNKKDTEARIKRNAYKLVMKYYPHGLKVSGTYELVSSSFTSLSGWANPDREKYKLKLSKLFLDSLNVQVAYENYHDNLLKYKDYTTYTQIPQASLDLYLGRIFSLYARYKYLLKTSDDLPKTTNNNTETYTSSINSRFKGISFSSTYEKTLYKDKANTTNNYSSDYYSFNASGDFYIERLFLFISPQSELRYIFDKTYDNSDIDKTKILAYGIEIEYKAMWKVAGEIASTFRDLDEGTDSVDDEITWYFQHKIKGDWNKTVKISYTENKYNEKDCDTNDYKEAIWKLETTLKF